MCLALPGKILSISEGAEGRQAEVDFDGALKIVNLAFAEEAKIGDYVLVHVGFALTVLDETEALQIRGYLDEIESGRAEG